MESLILIFMFVIGLFFGSFFCVIGMRLGREEGFVKGRSYCDHCHHSLSFLDMVPIFSYLFLRGKCRYCHQKISPFSTFIELFTGILFAISYYSFGFSYEFLLSLLGVSLFLIVLTSDLLYMIIPDSVLLFFSICFLIVRFFQGGFPLLGSSLLSGGILFLFMFLLMKLGNFLFKKESLGGGDVKLLFVIGLLLDPLLGLVAVFLGSFLALPVALVLYYRKKEPVIPYGPFLLLAALFLFFTKITSSELLSFLTNLVAFSYH